MAKRKSKRIRRQTNKSKKQKQKQKQRQTNKLKKVGGVVHEREDLPHYHLQVKLGNGPVVTLGTKFARTTPARTDIDSNAWHNLSVKSATVADIKEEVKDADRRGWLGNGDFTLIWKGKALTDPKLKIRKIIVDGEKLPLYDNQTEDTLIYAIPNDQLENIQQDIDLDLGDEETPN